jgi:membrane peptidoglycan carboxypeptidase
MVELVFGRERRGPRSHGRLYRLVVQVLRWVALIAAPALLRWGIRHFVLIGRLFLWIVALAAPVVRDWSAGAFGFVVPMLQWAAAMAALAGLCWGLSVESRTSYFQSRIFSSLTRDMRFTVEPGVSRSIRFPQGGPYDVRLGYAGLPMFVASLSDHHFAVQRQASWSAGLDRFVDRGGYAIYGEKSRAGLHLFDRDGNPLYAASYPERAYPDFASIPPVVVDSLLFIEDHDLLDPQNPRRNPAVEWSRFMLAVGGRIAGLVDRRFREGGASTLATQIEKFRHSPSGRTPGVIEKLRQMATASARAYRDGPDTTEARRRIVTTYLNSEPFASRPGYGEIIGVPEGLWLWYGTELTEADRVLSASAETSTQLARKGEVYRQVLSLLLAGRRPAYYLVENRAALAALTDNYLRLLTAAGIIEPQLRDAALHAELHFRADLPPTPAVSFVGNKATERLRDRLVSLLHVPDLYALDRLDLTGYATVDTPAQRRITDVLERLHEAAYDRSLGLVGKQLLGEGSPARVAWSVVLYERGADRNYVRIHADSLDEPFDINSGAKLQLGSTAKLRTLVTYLDVIEELHGQLAPLSRAELVSTSVAAKTDQDTLTNWAADYLASARDRSLKPMIAAAMERSYSGSPQAFITGGGVHAYANFEKWENHSKFTVADGFAHSINNVFIRLMRDLVRYYTAQSGEEKALSAARDDPEREALLARFVDQESEVYLKRFYRTYHGHSPDEALAILAHHTRPFPKRLAVVYLSVKPDASREELGAFLHRYLPHEEISDDDLWDLWRDYDVERFSLEDRGYLAGVHPLELWLVSYLQTHPNSTREEVTAASEDVRHEVYGWLYKGHSTHKQDVRIRILLEQDAFDRILQDWQRQGYPFGHLVPALGTAIGSSGDRPDALADLMGIILNDGVRMPSVDLERLHFAAGTPYDTEMVVNAKPQRVLAPEVAEAARQALLGVVAGGTARRLSGVYRTPNGGPLPVGGKTGTGDNRFDRFGAGGRLISQRVLDRTATFVFFLGDRFFGTITAYVPGSVAASYHFTSALAVQLLKAIQPQLEPLLRSPVTEAPKPISQVEPPATLSRGNAETSD